MAKKMTWSDAIQKILKESETALKAEDITEQILSRELIKSAGKKPVSIVKNMIQGSLRDDPNTSFVRVERGVFTLKGHKSSRVPEEPEENDKCKIISSFGMFWKRDNVHWSRTPRLLGKQIKGAVPVDFCEQRGIYLLYDGREVIYVGRATDTFLGKRLFKHHSGRLAGRWDRFSWFGLWIANEDDSFSKPSTDYDTTKLIEAFEAILIEALEPRQNRKRGDNLQGIEYLQEIDDKVSKKRKVKNMIDEFD